MSPEIRRKISEKLKGSKKSSETILKMRIAQKINKSNVSKETGLKISRAKKGKKASPETKLRMSLAQNGERGNKWKGGITPLYLQIRHHLKTRQWVSDCFTRDNFTCQKCWAKGGKLNCHHIKYFSKIISEYKIKNLQEALDCEELWNLNNGVTLCKNCHSLEHKENGYKI